ncbi:MAG: HAD hydrolase family protein, partial [Clostridiales bacterium]|nr:HAD hydrolase family protein [Clostridiales bacterium]
MIRLIACDLDGTLLNSRGELPAGTFDRIRRLKEKGVRFAAASGRQYGNLRRLFYPVRDEIAYLA